MDEQRQIQVTSFNSFQVNQTQTFEISLGQTGEVKPNDLLVSITNPILGSLDKQLDWTTPSRCRVSFVAPLVGVYTIKLHLANQLDSTPAAQFQARAYDLSKVFINRSSGRCQVNESYEFAVDASEAGEGQLEIAVNEGEIPNQVQVLDNGKCIVNFVPEELVEHVVDIKFNGHNVNGCPFVVQVYSHEQPSQRQPNEEETTTRPQVVELAQAEPRLLRDERALVDSVASFVLENLGPIEQLDKEDVLVIEPENRSVDFRLTKETRNSYRFEFRPTSVGDYAVELRPKSRLLAQLPAQILHQFPFSIKVFDFRRVIVSDVTDGVVGQPIYFFIDASQAGSGNLEIRVSSKTRNVPNYPQSEANAKIRVYFTPTEDIEHSIDVKFNGSPVPNNPFRVRVAQYPQARLPVASQDLLKYLAIDESVSFQVDYIGKTLGPSELSADCCQVKLLAPDFACSLLEGVELVRSSRAADKQQVAHFKVPLKCSKIGPYKLFITVNNELLPGCPILCNVYNINEVKVLFEGQSSGQLTAQPSGTLNQPITFTVDASRAGEGTLALAVVSSASKIPLETEVKVSEKGHGLYNLTFVPVEFAPHSIDMSFNERVVPQSPFVVDILNASGESALSKQQQQQQQQKQQTPSSGSQQLARLAADNQLRQREELVQQVESMHLGKQTNGSLAKTSGANKSKPSILAKQQQQPAKLDEERLLESIVVHGVSLKRTPVNSTGAFIIETNRLAQARDFDVLISDPSKNLVDVQCYLQQDGNLLAEWTPERVGAHKIEVLYRNQPVPGSPFQTHSFDPGAVTFSGLESAASRLAVGEPAELELDTSAAGQAELEVLLEEPTGDELALEPQPRPDGNLAVCFRPKLAGEHRLSVTLGGYEVPRSPLVLSVRDLRAPNVEASGAGLRCAELNRSAQFALKTSSEGGDGGGGELKLRIENGEREIVPKVERRGNCYQIKYKPLELGHASVGVFWNGVHIEGSPFRVPVNDLTQFRLLDPMGGPSRAAEQQPQQQQLEVEFEPRTPREIAIETSRCGPGELKAEAYCRPNPSIKFSIPVTRVSSGRHKLIFTCPPGPEQLATGTSLQSFPLEATYMIRFYYNNLAVPETLASVSLAPLVRNSSSSSSPAAAAKSSSAAAAAAAEQQLETGAELKSTASDQVVALRGHGLVEATSGQRAEFTIDGRNVGHGRPEVRLFCSANGLECKVRLEQVADWLYRASYEPANEGQYALNVHWDGKQVAGCPISVRVGAGCEPSRVVCTADSLKGAVLGERMKTFIDTKKAGPGELTALCTGPQKVASCELLDRGDGTFILYIKPQEAGRHFLTINYNGQHIPKSPFSFKVSGRPDPSRVRVFGPGVEHGVLSLYQSRFVCDTRGAGAGQLTVRIRGPKGAFRMETQRESQRDRSILCKYDPTEPGDYRIEIKWSGEDVPGSPFCVMIFDTQEELNRYLQSEQRHHQQLSSNNSINSSNNNNNNNAKVLPNGTRQQRAGVLQSARSGANHFPSGQQPVFRLQ